MIVERHYDEEALIGIAQATADVAEFRDPHLVSCASCADALQSFRSIAEVLRDESAWDLSELRNEPSGETMERLREFSVRQRHEEGQANALLDVLLDADRETWVSTVTRDIRFHTVGVARELIARSEAAIDTMPPDAVELGRAATALADLIEESEYDADVVRRLRGAAARQYAYALFYTGDAVRALQRVERAQRAFDQCAVADYEIARLNIVRALVYRALERHAEAVPLARSSARIFESYGDRQRLSSAYLAEAYLYLHMGRYQEALPVLRSVERLSSHVDSHTRAQTAANVAFCLFKMGNIPDALASYQYAAALFEELGVRGEAARLRFSVAGILRAEGQVSEARRRLVVLAEEVRTLGMVYLTVAVELDLAEILLAEGKLEDAERLCGDALAYFERSGITHAPGALIALAYLREAAAQRRLTREAVRHVKKYVERLETQPQLLFAPPPSPVQ